MASRPIIWQVLRFILIIWIEALSEKIEQISVFTGVENEFAKEYKTYDETYNGIDVHRINKFRRDYTYQQKFYDEKIELDFRKYLNKIKPDVVHFGHLSHLSTRLLNITASEFRKKIHDSDIINYLDGYTIEKTLGKALHLNFISRKNMNNHNCYHFKKIGF